MRKLSITCALMAIAVLIASSAWAAGRLNFMLINQTGHDIVDAKICPTYFPQFESKNLLKDALGANSRVYIGPNYYGEQNFWNIALKWGNGYEHTFTKLRLTRYNTYTVYSTPQGVKIRQSYEPASAQYEFGPDAPSYMIESDKTVVVSAPEKINAKLPDATVEPGKATAASTPRNLLFGDNGDAAKTLAMKTTVEMTRDGKTNTVLPKEDFKAGDKVRLVFSANKDGHIYWVSRNGNGQYQVVFPTAGNMDNAVIRNKEYTVPGMDSLQFDENKGTETFVAILAPKNVPDLDKAVQLQAEGKAAEASKLVSEVVNGHEVKRAANALQFEEEDEEDVNTQSQIADGEEPFVGTYELNHE